jgi:hypothetical protein
MIDWAKYGKYELGLAKASPPAFEVRARKRSLSLSLSLSRSLSGAFFCLFSWHHLLIAVLRWVWV